MDLWTVKDRTQRRPERRSWT